MMPPTRDRTGGVVFRIDFRMSGSWRTAREGGARCLEEGGGGGSLQMRITLGTKIRANVN
jgi:hypothetical protein